MYDLVEIYGTGFDHGLLVKIQKILQNEKN